MRVESTTPAGDTTASAPGRQAADLSRVAKEFESMLVRQLLETSRVMPGGSTERGMCTDALAQSVADRGGLGLARQIEETLRGGLRGAENRAGTSRPGEVGRSLDHGTRETIAATRD